MLKMAFIYPFTFLAFKLGMISEKLSKLEMNYSCHTFLFTRSDRSSIM